MINPRQIYRRVCFPLLVALALFGIADALFGILDADAAEPETTPTFFTALALQDNCFRGTADPESLLFALEVGRCQGYISGVLDTLNTAATLQGRVCPKIAFEDFFDLLGAAFADVPDAELANTPAVVAVTGVWAYAVQGTGCFDEGAST